MPPGHNPSVEDGPREKPRGPSLFALDCMPRFLAFLAALFLGVGTWVILIYLFRYSRIALLEEATFWISHFSFAGWLLCLALIGIYYLAISAFWLSGGRTRL